MGEALNSICLQPAQQSSDVCRISSSPAVYVFRPNDLEEYSKGRSGIAEKKNRAKYSGSTSRVLRTWRFAALLLCFPGQKVAGDAHYAQKSFVRRRVFCDFVQPCSAATRATATTFRWPV